MTERPDVIPSRRRHVQLFRLNVHISAWQNDKSSRWQIAAILLIFFSLGICFPAQAQTPTPRGHLQPSVLGTIVEAFRQGDSGTLMKQCGGRLDVTLFGMSELFSRSQARYVLHQFFDEYRPERVELTETSGSEGNWFAAGRYWYAGGEAPLAVYLRLRSGEGTWELREVRIGRTIGR